MKKKFLFIVIVFFVFHSQASDLLQIRSLHYKAIDDEKSCIKLIEIISKDSIHSNSTFQGYLASAHILMARHYWLPNKKLSSFSRGSKMLDSLINANPKNVEIRFLRYCIQYNVPSILGYHANLESDKLFLEANVLTLEDEDLQLAIRNFLQNPEKY